MSSRDRGARLHNFTFAQDPGNESARSWHSVMFHQVLSVGDDMQHETRQIGRRRPGYWPGARGLAGVALLTVVAPLAACSGGGHASPPPTNPRPDGGSSDAPLAMPFQADLPFTYVAKVKNLLRRPAAHRRRGRSGGRRSDQALAA